MGSSVVCVVLALTTWMDLLQPARSRPGRPPNAEPPSDQELARLMAGEGIGCAELPRCISEPKEVQARVAAGAGLEHGDASACGPLQEHALGQLPRCRVRVPLP